MDTLNELTISERFVTFFSSIAIFSTICLFFTGFEICWRIKQRGSTEGISSAPFHMGFISGSLWLQYGLLKGDFAVTAVNSVSSILYTCYVLYYYAKTTTHHHQKRQLRIILAEALTTTLAYVYVNYSGDDYFVILNRLGFSCMLFNIATVAAPLLALGEVIRARSTENLPLPLCVANFVVTSEWLIYGFIVDDFYIKMPNAIAVVISVAQILPFMIYDRQKGSPLIREPAKWGTP